jgi:hypothetical protein
MTQLLSNPVHLAATSAALVIAVWAVYIACLIVPQILETVVTSVVRAVV